MNSQDMIISRKFSLDDNDLMRTLCGEHNRNLGILENRIKVSVNLRGNTLTIRGGDWEVELAEKVLSQISNLLGAGYPLYSNDFEYAIRILSSDISADLKEIFRDEVYITSKKKTIAPKTVIRKDT